MLSDEDLLFLREHYRNKGLEGKKVAAFANLARLSKEDPDTIVSENGKAYLKEKLRLALN